MFLTQRTQKVTLEGIASNRCNPQCFLKVLLWDRCFSYYTQEPIIDGLLLYINDLPLGISSTIRLFGNDCSLYRSNWSHG